MKRVILSVFFLLALVAEHSAQDELPPVDKSPLDICYYPYDYPHLKVQREVSEAPVARVIYSRPRVEGRTVFGGIVTYGKLWRMGANEATEIEFYKPVTIDGKKVPKGRYTLYAIVDEKKWTIIINKDTDVWGSFIYDQSKDLLRAEVPVVKLEEPVEHLSMIFEKVSTGTIQLVIAWDTVKISLPVNL